MQAFSSSVQFARKSATLKLPEERRKWGESKEGGGERRGGSGGGGEREEKTPARKHCENEKHSL